MPPLIPTTTYAGCITVSLGRAPTMPPLAPPAMGDTTSFAERVQAWYEAWRTDTIARADEQSERPTPVTEVEKRVNDVIDDLSARKIAAPDRMRLRGALDKAEAPLTGRAGADAGLGNAIGRTERRPFSFTW